MSTPYELEFIAQMLSDAADHAEAEQDFAPLRRWVNELNIAITADQPDPALPETWKGVFIPTFGPPTIEYRVLRYDATTDLLHIMELTAVGRPIRQAHPASFLDYWKKKGEEPHGE